MAAAIIALFGTALFEAGRSDPAQLEPILTLLARSAEGGPITLAIEGNRLSVNGVPVPIESPGSVLVVEALRSHDTLRIQLPGGLEPRHWREVVQAYSAPHSILPTATHLRDALRPTLPLLEIWGLGAVAPASPAGAATPPDRGASEQTVTNRGNDLSGFSTELARLQTEGRAAAERHDAAAVARIVLRFAELEQGEAPGQAAIVAKERRRVVTPATLEWLVSEAAQVRAPAQIADALVSLGADIVEPILDEIARGANPGGRETLTGILARLPDLEAHLVAVLRGSTPSLLRGAAAIAGRRHLEGTIGALGALVRHPDADVRAAAWHALEAIGTQEAIAALNARNR